MEKVQDDQLAIARYLIREHGLQDVYFEGLTEQTLPDLRVRLDLLKTLDRLAALSGMDEAAASSARADPLGWNPWAAAAQWRDWRGADSGR